MDFNRAELLRDRVTDRLDQVLDLADPEPQPETGSYLLTRWIFLRLLGVVHLIAFWSLAVQIRGLVGSNGLFPVVDFLRAAYRQRGLLAVLEYPTLCWMDHGNAFLLIQCWLGVLLAVLLIVGLAPMPVLAGLWVLYLSLMVAGQEFLSFQWDALLLETTLIALFWAPRQLLPRFWCEDWPSTLGRWLVWWLLFRLMVLSGLTKLLSGDEAWLNLTALRYHFETQPLPTPLAWYFHHLPDGLLQLMCLLMFVIELGAPLAIFVPYTWRAARYAACGLLVLLQAAIWATGNYGFFNLLSIVLCLTLLDDAAWEPLTRWLPARARVLIEDLGEHEHQREPQGKRIALLAFAFVTVLFSAIAFLHELVATAPSTAGGGLARGLSAVLTPVRPLRSINGYGLFRVMTRQRKGIQFEGSNDGRTFVEYAFRYQPSGERARPAFIAPYMPRFDWLLWFAPLNRQTFDHLVGRCILQFNQAPPEVMKLFGVSPFPAGPPRHVRSVIYTWRFSGPRSRDAWWERTDKGVMPAFTLRAEPKRP